MSHGRRIPDRLLGCPHRRRRSQERRGTAALGRFESGAEDCRNSHREPFCGCPLKTECEGRRNAGSGRKKQNKSERVQRRTKPQPMQADCHDQIQMENGLHPAHSESRRLRREGVTKMMIELPEKYALEVSSRAQITSERQHEEYLSVLDKQ